MTVYDLYVESGPKHRTTMVHVPALLGCNVTGPTTAEALAASPEILAAFRRFLHRHGEDIDPDAPFETRVVEHSTRGLMQDLPTDLTPLPDDRVEHALTQLDWINDALGTWALAQPPEQLASKPETGWAAQRILLHVLGDQGSYLASAFGSAPGFGPIHRKAERGDIPLDAAIKETVALCREHVANATPRQRTGIRQMEHGPYTLHRALRRMNEHAWEHLAELSRRPNGPVL
ncbi:hypothetical protein BH20CHL4_BH20CHL4_11090 [soil metagenome]